MLQNGVAKICFKDCVPNVKNQMNLLCIWKVALNRERKLPLERPAFKKEIWNIKNLLRGVESSTGWFTELSKLCFVI